MVTLAYKQSTAFDFYHGDIAITVRQTLPWLRGNSTMYNDLHVQEKDGC